MGKGMGRLSIKVTNSRGRSTSSGFYGETTLNE